MKKTLLVLASLDRTAAGQKISLPSIVSSRSVQNHLLKILQKLKPQRIGLLGIELNNIPVPGRQIMPGSPDRALSFTLANLVKKVEKGKKTSDLILLSSEFFPAEADIIKKILAFHQKSANDLTLVGEKTRSRSARRGEEYFVYPGIAFVLVDGQRQWLSRVRPFKPSGHLDVVALVEAAWAADRRIGFYWVREADRSEFIQINSLNDYSKVAEHLRQTRITELEKRGVFFLDPSSVWIDPRAEVGRGTVIYPSVVVEGKSRIGQNCLIYPHCHIIDSRLGHRVKVFGASVIEGCRIENEVQVGPFSRLRPETRLRRGSRVGNFVEMKKTVFGPESKAMHLSYLGDTRVEDQVNVGAGTITCNYDGERKHRTFIGRKSFIGSGTELVAPVKIGRGAYVAAGSTITENVRPEALAIARARQVHKPGWVRDRLARKRVTRRKPAGKKK